ncbi:TetR/AcrR family transcriptional regulator [Bacillus altitudinis]|uniref:TetR/AcrR family transcriptional regulator n=1 Tax=Bacillus altitudinis TaxID=293387 RepID=UPI003AF6EB64
MGTRILRLANIIKKIGVAKGTFYHYFKSKDEIADAVIQDSIDSSVQLFKQINNNSDLKAIEKFINIIQFFFTGNIKSFQ